MTFWSDLGAELSAIAAERWTSRTGIAVPEQASVTFGHDAVVIDAVVLYCDMAASTNLVKLFNSEFAATCYKAFLTCALRTIRHFDGAITAFREPWRRFRTWRSK